MKKIYGIILGIVAFGVVSALVSKAFQKPPEQIAKEKCAEILVTSNALGVNAPITVYVEGVPYKCN